jgi:uncharacterized protein (DUF2147 family)
MKTGFIPAVMVWLLLAVTVNGFSQTPEKLTGTWVNAQNTRKTEFYAEGGKYFGKLVWVADDSKAKAGDIIVKDLVWDGKVFTGTIVTPAMGEMSCKLSFQSDDKITITGSKGFASKSVYWTRVK